MLNGTTTTTRVCRDGQPRREKLTETIARAWRGEHMLVDPRLAEHHLMVISSELALAVREADRALKHYNSEWYGGHFGLRGCDDLMRGALARYDAVLVQRLATYLEREFESQP